MSRIFVLGTGPLLEEGAKIMSGQCLRTWHFCGPLLAAGHRVHLMTVPIPGTTRDESEPPIEEAEFRRHRYGRLLSNDPARIMPLVQTAIERLKPEAVVGINAWPAFLLAQMDGGLPLWADLNGWTMAEGLVRAAVVGHDREFGHFWRTEALTLLRADRFSTVTERQGYALQGELAMLGRLDHRNFAEDFVSFVPNAIYPPYAELKRVEGVPDFLREKLPADAKICLWSGGFNSWTDVETLTAGFARAMQEEPSLHLVCTGGAVHGHDELTYEKFRVLAAERFPEGRCLQLGWTDFAEVLALHACAIVGINIDGDNVETRFGARNRLTNMLGAGLPVMTTRGTEVAEWIEKHEAGCVFAGGDGEVLAARLVEAVREQSAWRERGTRARTRALQEFAPENTLREFLSWAEAPALSAEKQDHGAGQHPPGRLRRWVLRQCENPLPFSGEESGLHAARCFLGMSRARKVWNKIRSITGGKR